jgi:phage terminase large subunit-like protein
VDAEVGGDLLDRHPVLTVTGNPHDIVAEPIEANKDNLGSEVIADLRSTEALACTQAGREELDGIFSDDDADALWKSEYIDDHRRDEPERYERRILIVDPAISKRKSSDQTGISELGLGSDGQIYVIGDWTAHYTWEDWGDVILDKYEMGRCDCVVVERNRGGDAVAANLRGRAQSPDRIKLGRTLRVVLVDAKAKTRWDPGTVYVKEVHARGQKDERAGPVVGLYKSGRVSHVRTANLDELEELMVTWVPDPLVRESPDRMDAMVHGVWELARLALGEVAGHGLAAFRTENPIQHFLYFPNCYVSHYSSPCFPVSMSA